MRKVILLSLATSAQLDVLLMESITELQEELVAKLTAIALELLKAAQPFLLVRILLVIQRFMNIRVLMGRKYILLSHFRYYDYNTLNDCIIRAYPDKYTSEFEEYSFSKFVGFLTRENNYYLDLGARTIDEETKWSEYKYTTDPTTVSEGTSNNKEAFNCAKSNYYQNLSNYYDSQYITLRLDLTDSTLERHTYTMLGEDSIITYTAKWF